MARDLDTALRDLCSHLPECEEVLSHGSPNFKVRGKTFASYHVNHHGDGRVALWLAAPDGAQQLYTEMEPEHYFVPPYVGPRGWLGVEVWSRCRLAHGARTGPGGLSPRLHLVHLRNHSGSVEGQTTFETARRFGHRSVPAPTGAAY